MADEPHPFASVTTTPEQALAFLEGLATDDDLRDALQQDPAGVLRGFGIAVSPELVPATIELPSKEDCAQLLERLDEDPLRVATGGEPMVHPFMHVVHPWLQIVVGIAGRRGRS